MSEVVRIASVTRENYDTMTFTFPLKADAKPGQFVMVRCEGSEEIPMSLSSTAGGMKSITVKAIGPSTKRFHELKAGDILEVRGPYGNGYTLESGKRYLIVAGGVGTASVMPAAEMFGSDLIIGARTDKDVILLDRAKQSCDVSISTDDGSMGFHGNAVQLMRQKLEEKKYDCVIACGPPIMLKFLYLACKELGMECQLSLERHMKCGAGVCGCCVIDGLRVCKDGPVFTGEQIALMPEFGTVRRDECGVVIRK